MGGPEIERLIDLLGKLPGLGPRSARRAALSLLRQPQARMLPLAGAMQQAARTVQTCALCGNLDSRDPCTICADPGRDRGLICVVEGVGDLWALERAGVHQGLYHVLGGTLSPLGGIGPEDLNLPPLVARLQQGGAREVILALGATVEGATTVHWLSERLAEFGVPISRVGQGVPMGGALDVLDDGTLAAALMARRLDPALPVMKALGVAPFAAQLRGEMSAADALAQAQTDTRHYAKRQTTWLRNQTPGWPRIDAAEQEAQWEALRALEGFAWKA